MSEHALVEDEHPGDTLAVIMKLKSDEMKYRRAVHRAICLLGNDAYAITFQSMGQYRSALIKYIYDNIKDIPHD